MYDDSWYSFVPDVRAKEDDGNIHKSHHRRRESLLKQPNDGGNIETGHAEPLAGLFEESVSIKSPPQATVVRRAKSYSDFYRVARAQLMKESSKLKGKIEEPTMPAGGAKRGLQLENIYERYEDQLLDASKEEFQIYRDQLALSRRHLDGLLQDTSLALDLLANLSGSFKFVEAQTMAFQAQCEDLLAQQKQIKHLSEQVGTGLQYYAYLEPITRRLNAPGASSMIGDDGFVEMLTNLDACVDFMIKHPEHRESEIYLTRYKSLLARTLSLITNKFSRTLKQASAEANRAEEERRKATGRLTMTNFYIFQGAQSEVEARMPRTVRYLVWQARNAIVTSRDAQSIEERNVRRGQLADYEGALKTMIEDYVGIRLSNIPDRLRVLLTQTISEESSPMTSFARYAQECLNSAMDTCKVESIRFLTIFESEWKTLQYSDDASPIVLSIQNGDFKNYMLRIASLVFEILQPVLERIDIYEAVRLSIWLNGYVSYHNTSGEVVSSHSDNEYEEEERDEIPRRVRSIVGLFANKKIIVTIFGRIRDILLKDVERYTGNPEDFINPGNRPGHDSDFMEHMDQVRILRALGDGINSAYPPVKVACRLLIYVNDLTVEDNGANESSEITYEILHHTCTAITRAGNQLSQMDGRIFAIKHLILLKNLMLAYEISGSHRASALDFTSLWATFTELRARGGLFDITSYYNLLTSGNLLPRVIENVLDARVELDGLLRKNITMFLEEGAQMILKDRSSGRRGVMTAEEQIHGRLTAAYPQEELLREGLWEALQQHVDKRRRGK